jgi:VWFA-related protein
MLIVLFLLALPILSQSPAAPPKQDEPFVFRSTTRLVQVNVVVRDHKGHPVADLKKEDFTISEEGKPQEISFFSVESLGSLPVTPVKIIPHLFSNRLAARSGVPPGVTVILLDSLNTTFEDQAYARSKMIEFLLDMKTGDRVAIYQLGNRLNVVQDYTTDCSELVKHLRDAHGEIPAMQALEQFRSVDQGAGRRADGMEADRITADRITNTLDVLAVIARHLSSVQGRKNLIWISGGFPISIGYNQLPMVSGMSSVGINQGALRDHYVFGKELTATVRALNDAGVAIYPVDARGKGLSGAPPNSSMLELASQTGGRAYYNSTDIKGAIQQAISDSEVTYTIGYHPTSVAQDGKFREIKLKVDRSGVSVSYRKGYFAIRPVDEDATVRQAQMDSAVWSPLDSTALPFNVRVDFLPLGRDPKTAPSGVHLFVQTDVHDVKIEEDKGSYTGHLEVVILQKDEHGELAGKATSQTVNLDLKPDTFQKVVKQGLIYEKVLPHEAAATTLRVVVRDTSTGAIGSVTVPYKEVN